MLQQPLRARKSAEFNFSVTANTQRDQIGQLVGALVIAAELAIGSDVMHGNNLALSLLAFLAAYLALVPVTLDGFASLTSPVGTAIADCAASIVDVTCSASRFTHSLIATFIRAIPAVAFSHKESGNCVWLPTDGARFSNARLRDNLRTMPRAKTSRAIRPTFKFIPAGLTLPYFPFVWVSRVAFCVLIGTFAGAISAAFIQRILISREFLAAPRTDHHSLMSGYMASLRTVFPVGMLHIHKYLAAIQTFYRLMFDARQTSSRAIFFVGVFGISKHLAARGAGFLYSGHSAHPYANIHIVRSQSGGCAAFSGATLDCNLILPQNGAKN